MPSPMTKEDSSRVQSTQAKGGHDMSSGGFAARAQSAGDRNAASGGGNNGGAAQSYNGGAQNGGQGGQGHGYSGKQ